MIDLMPYFLLVIDWLSRVFGMISNIFNIFPVLLPTMLTLFAISVLVYKLVMPIVGGNLPPSPSDRAQARDDKRRHRENNEMHDYKYDKFKKAQIQRKINRRQAEYNATRRR